MTLIRRLIEAFREPLYRHAYMESALDSWVATQIKVLREQRELSQAELADLAGMRQSQISRLESINNGSWTVSTLKKLARAFDVALTVRFETFGRVLPDIDQFSRGHLERAAFRDDPVFAAQSSDDEHQADVVSAPEIQQASTTAHVLRFRSRNEPAEMTLESTAGGSGPTYQEATA